MISLFIIKEWCQNQMILYQVKQTNSFDLACRDCWFMQVIEGLPVTLSILNGLSAAFIFFIKFFLNGHALCNANLSSLFCISLAVSKLILSKAVINISVFIIHFVTIPAVTRIMAFHVLQSENKRKAKIRLYLISRQIEFCEV
jgi:hypothetical protein